MSARRYWGKDERLELGLTGFGWASTVGGGVVERGEEADGSVSLS